jgi:peptide subunit release factor 1 (eRF1)
MAPRHNHGVSEGEPQVRRVSRRGMLGLCERLDGVPGSSLYAPDEVRFDTPGEHLVIIPPFPMEERGSDDAAVRTGALRDALVRRRRLGLVVARLGGFGAGVYDDERMVQVRSGTRFVKNRNKKGGSSSGRFARRRGEQARDLHDRAAALADEVLAPYARSLDHLVLAGDRLALAAVVERSSLLRSLERLLIPSRVPVPGDPRRATLEAMARELWSSQVSRYQASPGGRA